MIKNLDLCLPKDVIKNQNTVGYCAFVRNLSYGSNRSFGVGLRVV